MQKDYVLQYRVYKTKVIFTSDSYPDLKSVAKAYHEVSMRMIRDGIRVCERSGKNLRTVKDSELDRILDEVRAVDRI